MATSSQLWIGSKAWQPALPFGGASAAAVAPSAAIATAVATGGAWLLSFEPSQSTSRN